MALACPDTPRVLYLASELAPWMKSGGLGEVARTLPESLRAAGVDVRVLVPGYAPLLAAHTQLRLSCELACPAGVYPTVRLFEAATLTGLPLYVIDCPRYYDRTGSAYQDAQGGDFADNAQRFGLLSYIGALIGSCQNPLSWQPNVLHANDWHCALAMAYLRYRLEPRVKTVFTIHNLAYQGLFAPAMLDALGLPPEAFQPDKLEFWGQFSFLKAALLWADRLLTVSPRYAREIQTPEYGCGLEGLLCARSQDLSGILNGIDDEAWNPATDEYLVAPYDGAHLDAKSANKQALQGRLGLEPLADVPLFAVISRLTHQKGLDLLLEIAPALVALPAQLVVLGHGEPSLEDAFCALAASWPGKIATVLGFEEALAHQIEAGADAFVMPSRYEPCGLNQMYSLRYGTPPIVRATGGLADTVVDASDPAPAGSPANGFVFEEFSPNSLMGAMVRAVDIYRQPECWRVLQRAGMALDLGWTVATERHRFIYNELVGGVGETDLIDPCLIGGVQGASTCTICYK